MVILRRTIGGSYRLAELDGAVSTLHYAAFRLVPYHLRDKMRVPVTTITGLGDEELDRLTQDEIKDTQDEDPDPHTP
jgi:hypothetical protein